MLLAINILLAGTWALAAGGLNPLDLAVGFLLGAVLLWLFGRPLGSLAYLSQLWRALLFAGFFLRSLLASSLGVGRLILSPGRRPRPMIVALPLDLEGEAEVVLLAGLLTLTPGTLGLEISTDRRTLFLHRLDARDPESVRREVKRGLERRLAELLR